MQRATVSLVVAAALGAALPAAAGLEQALDSYRSSQFQEAANEFSALIETSPGYAYGHFMLGNARAQLGQLDEAAGSYRSAIAIDGSRSEYHANLANVYAKQHKWSEVVSALDNALALADEQLERLLYELRGGAYAQLGEWVRAVADLERAAPGPRVLETLGMGYLKLGHDEDAARTLARVVATDPQNARVRALACEALLNLASRASDGESKRRLYADALRTAEEYARLVPTTFEADYFVGRAALGAGALEQALQSLAAALERRPDHCYARVDQGRAWMGKENWTAAAEAFEQATRCNEGLADAWADLAYSLQRQGRLEDAIAAYERALALGSPSSFAQENYRICLTNLEVREHNRALGD